MVTVSPRTLLVAAITPKLPKTWALVKHERNVDEKHRIYIVIRQRSIKKLPEAPQGYYLTNMVLELVTPETNPIRAEDSLDAAVLQLLAILDSINPTLWQTAEKVLDKDTGRLAYDVTINLPSSKD